MRIAFLLMGLVLVAGLAVAAPSETVGTVASNPSVTPPQGEKLICRKQIETGSLVRGKKTCLTRAEWAKIGDAARDGGQYLLEQNEGKPSCDGASSC